MRWLWMGARFLYILGLWSLRPSSASAQTWKAYSSVMVAYSVSFFFEVAFWFVSGNLNFCLSGPGFRVGLSLEKDMGFLCVIGNRLGFAWNIEIINKVEWMFSSFLAYWTAGIHYSVEHERLLWLLWLDLFQFELERLCEVLSIHSMKVSCRIRWYWK